MGGGGLLPPLAPSGGHCWERLLWIPGITFLSFLFLASDPKDLERASRENSRRGRKKKLFLSCSASKIKRILNEYDKKADEGEGKGPRRRGETGGKVSG